jgi:prophage antirepressor-like protein
MLPESLADAQPYFVAAAAASLLGVVAPTGRIEDVHIAVRVAPLVVFAVLYAAAKATE